MPCGQNFVSSLWTSQLLVSAQEIFAKCMNRCVLLFYENIFLYSVLPTLKEGEHVGGCRTKKSRRGKDTPPAANENERN